ncbi:hypothetical protein IQ07DRAFT_592815 [Pyrenochaeta sp. DS3sAY3a]|nr:hypothetical protein IQ07DRAFT_592815 [Pyrenochaeta sp. DS3sAY3a]
MANNYSQPYYGLPFGYPPPQMPQPAPGTHPDERAPPPSSFPPIPGLQPGAIPGLNLSAYNQNGQQPPLPQFAWPPQSHADISALLPFFQHGALPPPPPPGLGFPPPSLPQHPPNLATPVPLPPQQFSFAAPQPAAKRAMDVMDIDREDGELSDQGAASRTQAGPSNGQSRSRFEVPRSAPPPPLASPRGGAAYNPDAPAAGHEENRQLSDQVAKNVKDREEAKKFIKLLHSNNIGYHALAQENLDVEALRELYQSMNLPSEPAPILAPKTNGNAPTVANPSTSIVPQQPTPTTKASNPVPVTKKAASPTSSGDRKDYIARLQAAKLANQAGTSKPSPPHPVPSTNPNTSAEVLTSPHVGTITPKQPVTVEQRARNTELIRQRLEAMRAKQKQPSIIGSSTPSSLPKRPDFPQASTGTSPQAKNLDPGAPTYVPSRASIPGLFINAQPGYMNGPSTPKSVSSIPQKRPAPSGESTPQGSVTPYTRPLGQSQIPEKPMILHVSDDESNGSEMDIDDEIPASKPLAPLPNPAPSQLPSLGQQFDISSRSNSAKPASSAMSTPGPQTPASLDREKELEKKEQELAKMKLIIKKKLAEKREKDKAAKAAAEAASSPLRQESTPRILPSQTSPRNEIPAPVPGSMRSDTAAVNDVSVATATNGNPITNTKRHRRAEIESKLPVLDAEMEDNKRKLAKLAQEMEQLKAQNERLNKDKEQLAHELESLGIDIEGMSHAELRAKRNEIEREASLEPQATPQSKVSVSVSRPSSQCAAPSARTQAPNGFAFLPGLGQGSHQAPQAPQQPSTHVTKESQAQMDLEMTSATATAHETRSSATPVDDEEDFYNTAPPVVTKLTVEPATDAQPASQPEEDLNTMSSPSEEGEVDMSESEEEYVPDEAEVNGFTDGQDVNMSEPEIVHSLATSQVTTEDEDMYEPPDIDQALPDVQDENGTTASTTDQPMAEADDGAMDIATSDDSSEDSESDSSSEDETSPVAQVDPFISAHAPLQQDTDIVEVPAPQLQPETVPAGPASESISDVVDEIKTVKFTPYVSPLRHFKSYRYHPNFTNDVAGGFLSTTFSHQIDPNKPLCQYETAGGSCNDSECPNQHFRDFGVSGEKMLVQLGTANPGKTAEEKQQWNNGLRNVLSELRQKNIKDPDGIAMEISKFRRRFLDDETRVVIL